MKKDMASGYIAAVLEHLPGADLVLAPLHRVKWFNGKLSNVRPVRLTYFRCRLGRFGFAK